jgi:Family of unknown function (DUF6504)
MRGIRGEPVEVWLRSGRPARFVWRGRMHTVIFVLERQVRPAATPADPGPSGPASSGPAASGPAASGSESSGAESSGAESSGPESSSTAGSECWRVEATPGRSVPPATYELCRDLESGRWLLSRA